MNRYSDYGNDTPGHLNSFYFYHYLKKDFNLENKENFKLFSLISLFCFLNRFLIIIYIFSNLYLDKKKHFYHLSSFPNFFFYFFVFLDGKKIF